MQSTTNSATATTTATKPAMQPGWVFSVHESLLSPKFTLAVASKQISVDKYGRAYALQTYFPGHQIETTDTRCAQNILLSALRLYCIRGDDEGWQYYCEPDVLASAFAKCCEAMCSLSNINPAIKAAIVPLQADVLDPTAKYMEAFKRHLSGLADDIADSLAAKLKVDVACDKQSFKAPDVKLSAAASSSNSAATIITELDESEGEN
jgi:hypothetical protein